MSEVFVISETRRVLDWFYDSDNKQYIRRDKEGNMDAIVDGIHIPDPHMLTDKLQEASRKGMNQSGRLNADPVTYALWEHWMHVNA